METKKKITRENVGEHLFDYQLKIVGKTRVDVINDDRWHFNWTMTQAQFMEFYKYAIKVLQKVFHCNRVNAVNAFNFYWSQFKVRIKN